MQKLYRFLLCKPHLHFKTASAGPSSPCLDCVVTPIIPSCFLVKSQKLAHFILSIQIQVKEEQRVGFEVERTAGAAVCLGLEPRDPLLLLDFTTSPSSVPAALQKLLSPTYFRNRLLLYGRTARSRSQT